MNLANAADAASHGWLDSLRRLGGTQPTGFFEQTAAGTAVIVTGVPFASLNGIASISRTPCVDEISELSDSPRLREVPWTIKVRGDAVDPEVVAVADDHGLAKRESMPLMLRGLTPDDAAGVPGVQRVTGTGSIPYQRTLAAGFEGPEPLFAVFADAAVLEAPGMSGYVVEADGVPVATAFGVITGDMVGVFNVAVPPAFRRKGYGRQATAAVLADGYRAGARTAFLHSSEAGMPLYEQMGFQLAENWSVFAAI
ncbi:GNAT family N-acetyltransferase [Actinoplanes bogorensis]|uniref:GNAT family N-acetyltransferase n=1 Tax=Paractinoplanes bogorensis TaxID=1610840 RepID=A0ABS5YNI8_9ACTN|nr:GNAT family N-acetyltransferase [Actinoplanes bogorensis]MBU2665020.1 GNAT family N-acetyltransferase [Actinoplanes bogorensis]